MDAEMIWTLIAGITRALVVWVICLLSRKAWDKIMSDKCMIRTCMRQSANKRGLCLICYSQAKNKVESGQTTWDRLEALKLVLPEATPFDAAFNEATTSEATTEDMN